MSRNRELREKRARLVAEAQRLIPADGQRLSSEHKLKFDLLMSEVDELKKEIDTLEARAESSAADADLRRTQAPREAQITPFEEARQSSEDRAYRRAFNDYLKNGLEPGNFDRGMSSENRELLSRHRQLRETRDMGVGTGNLGGFFVPQGFVYEIEEALKYYGNMLGISRILPTATGNPLPYPTSSDITNVGELVGEGAQVSDQDVSVGHITFGAFKFGTKMVKVSLELLQDSAFDMEAFLVEQFSIRLGRILNTKFTVGVGTTEPFGVMTAATAGPTAVGSSANTGGTETGGTSIGYIDLVELEHSIDPLYRRGAKFMCHDSTLKKIKEILDKYGRPIWVPGVAAGAPDTILGYQYSVNNDMAPIAVSAHSVAFGPFNRYLIRQVKDLMVMRLVERFADYGMVAFLGFARYDANLLDAGSHPIRYLVQAAT